MLLVEFKLVKTIVRNVASIVQVGVVFKPVPVILAQLVEVARIFIYAGIVNFICPEEVIASNVVIEKVYVVFALTFVSATLADPAMELAPATNCADPVIVVYPFLLTDIVKSVVGKMEVGAV